MRKRMGRQGSPNHRVAWLACAGVKLRALTLAVLVAFVAGCGGDDEEKAATAPVAQAELGPVTISKPKEGDRVKARSGAARVSAKATVSGLADAGEQVVVSGGCNIDGCVVHGTADAEGRWEAEVVLAAPPSEPRVRITAYYRGSPVVGPDDDVEVRLVARGGAIGGGGGGGRGPDVPVPPSDLDPDQQASPSGPGTMVLVGDSLAVGIEPYMDDVLPGWKITSDALTGRPLASGMEVLSGLDVPPGSVIAISLFTNDDPANLGGLQAAVRTTVQRAGPGGCAVWATILRPPLNGRSYAGANALLRSLDVRYGNRMALVPWAELASRSGWIADDQVHATTEGYQHRARLYAEAAQSCR